MFLQPPIGRFFVRITEILWRHGGLDAMNEVLRQEKKFAINIADGAVLGGRLGAIMHADVHNGT